MPVRHAQRRLPQFANSAAPDVETRVALSALDRLKKGVAAVGFDNGILYCNARFRELFAGNWLADLGDVLTRCRAASRECTQTIERNGRTLHVRADTLEEGVLLTADDISLTVAEQARAEELARTDPLTQLGNRRLLRDSVMDALPACTPADPAAVLLIDLDRFKTINDSLGHAVGDSLLRTIAQRIRSCGQSGEITTRIGGDEFAVLQTGQPQPSAASILAKRIVDVLGRPYLVDGHVLNIGCSVGVALISSPDAHYDDVIADADLAMYQAKQDGRGTFRFYKDEMREAVRERRELETELRRALVLREFDLHYQPQLDVRAKAITGFEALLRWNSEKRGFVSPATFIPLAEELGLIVPIGEWVLRTACREAATWAEPLNIAVNVSAVQIESDSLLPTVVSALAESGISPGRLELEITGSVLLGDHQRVLRILHAVRELGVRISMDDFGTGYSSLSYLRSFPFDKIKIDQSFVRGKDAEQNGMPIVRAIAALGQSLGMTTIAEGVETSAQTAEVTAAGCTAIQGYAISKPMPSDQIPGFLATRSQGASVQ